MNIIMLPKMWKQTVFGRLGRIWASKKASVAVKATKRGYTSCWSCLFYFMGLRSTRSTKQESTKKLEAAQHWWWLRKILHISWKDKVKNEKVRHVTQQEMFENIIRERKKTAVDRTRLMNQDSITKAAVKWIPPKGKRKPGHPNIYWIQTVTSAVMFIRSVCR